MVEGGLVTAQALAKELNLSVETIWRYTRQQKIPSIDLGSRQYRYRLPEVLRALSGKMTYEDYVALPDEPGYRIEILDGLLVKDPSPNVLHQRVSRRLQRVLEDYFRVTDPEGEVFNAPLDLTLGKHTVVQPDLFYVAGSQKELVQHARVDGVPTLAVEILSPSSGRKDRLQKLRIYQSAGLPHYWIVDPDHRTVECFCLSHGSYALVATGMEDEELEPPAFSGLRLVLATLW